MWWIKKTIRRHQHKTIKIFDNGQNNKIEIQNPDLFLHSHLTIEGNNCHVIIKNIRYIRHSSIWIYNGDNQTLVIDDDVSIEGAKIYLCGTGSKLTIGEDSMLAAGISIWTADGHTIIDNKTNKVINNKENHVAIGKHVWLSQDVKLLKNAKIADGCIIGASSVVSKEFQTPNSIITGNPAKQIKNNICWKRDNPYQRKDI